jgi:HD-GYP domain-containing protein (c-di-GMP phosphodiesterase class II)
MNTVSIDSLPDNSYIDSPVFLDGKFILLSPDIPIKAELKRRLREWGFSEILTDGSVTDGPAHATTLSPELGTALLEKNIKEHEQYEEAVQFFTETVKFLDEVFELYLERDEFRINQISDRVKAMITMVKNSRRFIMSIPEPEKICDNYIVCHSVNSTFVLLALADYLKVPLHRQIEIGLAGLLHEIGMLRIPKEIYLGGHSLSEKEKQIITTHPVIAFRVLKNAGFPMPVCLAVLEHHEAVDGSGYPRKLTGDKISLYGKMLTIACQYNASTSRRPYRDGLDGHTGIMDMLKLINRNFDEKIMRAFVFTLSIYPIGTYVGLSNDAVGRVIRTNPEDPKNPVIELLLNEEGVPYMEQPILQTREGDEIRITKALNKQEVEELKEKLPQNSD